MKNKSMKNNWTRGALSALFCVALAFAPPAVAAKGKPSKFNALHALGDSLTDTGNLAAILRFSDGPVLDAAGVPLGVILKDGRLADDDLTINRLADDLDLDDDAIASALDGGNFAVAGAVANPDLAPFSPFTLPGTDVRAQAGQLVSTRNLGNEDLVVIFIGSNDIFAALFATAGFPPGSFDPAAALDVSTSTIRDVMKELAVEGARNFLVFEAPNVGRTPVLQQQVEAGLLPPESRDLARDLTVTFNQQLLNKIGGLRADSGFSANVWYVPTFTVAEFIASRVGARVTGISSTTPCAPDFGFAIDCAKSSFWDFVHPSSAVHGYFADVALLLLRMPALVRR